MTYRTSPRARARAEQQSEEKSEREFLSAVAWVRQHFSHCYYIWYKAADRGQPKYLEVQLRQPEHSGGMPHEQLVSVSSLARRILGTVPDFAQRPPEQVRAILAEESREHNLGLEPLLERMDGLPSDTERTSHA